MEKFGFHSKKGRMLKTNIPMQTFYSTLQPRRFLPGTFLDEETIREYNIPDHFLIDFTHPDSLRIRGAFEFARKKKGKFSVAIIRTWNGRGDVLMSSVIAKALKCKYGEDVSVWFVVLPGYEGLLLHNPYIDRIITNEEHLSRVPPDITFNVNDLEFRAETAEFEKLGIVTRNRASIYLSQVELQLENKTPTYVVTDQEKEWAKKELKDLGYKKTIPIIGIQLYGSNPSRTYPYMYRVGIEMKNEGHQVFYLDKKEREVLYKYNLREVAALIDKMAVTITPNSFFYHLAGAMKKRAVALFGYTDGEVWTQDYEKVTVAQIECPKGEKKCWWKIKCMPGDFGEKQRRTPECLSAIPVKLVTQRVRGHLAAKKILIVILTYNFLGLTRQMIDSIRSFHNYDIFVIDNASTDGTQEWLKEEGIKFVSKPMSVPEAWNLGMLRAYNKGYDYCLLCNNDILLSSSYIDMVVEVADRKQAYAVTGNVVEKGTGHPATYAEQVTPVEKEIGTMVAGDYSALLISRECVEKIGKFDERFKPRYQSDEDHLLRLRLAGKSIIKTYATTFFHMLGAVVKSSPKAILQHEKEWKINVDLFKELWGLDPYKERHKLIAINHIKHKNKDWEKRICIPFKELKK